MILAQIVLATLFAGVLPTLATASFGMRVPGWLAGSIAVFAAGMLLAMACLEILPHGMQVLGMGQTACVFIAGLFFFFVASRRSHHRSSLSPGAARGAALATRSRVTRLDADIAPVLLMGDGVHNAVDGVLVAAAFLQDTALGWSAAFAVALHEVPLEFGEYLLMVWSGMRPQQALLWNAASGACTVLGGIPGFFVLRHIDGLLNYALVFAAGSLVFVAAVTLIPRMTLVKDPAACTRFVLCFLAGGLFFRSIGMLD